MTEEHQVVKDQISIKELLLSTRLWYHYVVNKRTRIIIVTVLGALAGFAYSMISVPKYIARTSFVLENTKKGSLGDYASLAAKFGFGSGGGGGLFQEDNNIIALLTSRTMVAKALYSPVDNGESGELLVQRYFRMYGLDRKWSDDKRLHTLAFHADSLKRNRLEDSVVTFFYKRILKGNLYVDKPDKDEGIIFVTTVAPDEIFAKSFNEHLLQNAVTSYINYQTQKSQENVDILQYQVDSVRYLLNAALSGVALSSEANPNPNPAFQRLKVPSQKKMVDVEMSKAMLEELVKNLELSKIALRKEAPLIQTIDTPVLPLEIEYVHPLKSTVLGLLVSFVSAVFFYTLRFNLRQLLA